MSEDGKLYVWGGGGNGVLGLGGPAGCTRHALVPTQVLYWMKISWHTCILTMKPNDSVDGHTFAGARRFDGKACHFCVSRGCAYPRFDRSWQGLWVSWNATEEKGCRGGV